MVAQRDFKSINERQLSASNLEVKGWWDKQDNPQQAFSPLQTSARFHLTQDMRVTDLGLLARVPRRRTKREVKSTSAPRRTNQHNQPPGMAHQHD